MRLRPGGLTLCGSILVFGLALADALPGTGATHAARAGPASHPGSGPANSPGSGGSRADSVPYGRLEGIYALQDGRHLVITDLVDQMPGGAHQLMALEPGEGWVRTLYLEERGGLAFEAGGGFFQREPVVGHVTFAPGESAESDAVVWIDAGGREVRGVRAPVREREIRFRSGDAMLAGSLILPPDTVPGPHPALVFLHGSGPLTRRSPRQVGYQMAAHGVAAVVFDKRGTGGSEGSFRLNDIQGQARDAIAALDYARSLADLDPDRIGLYAASEGGFAAPHVVAERPDLAALICRVCSILPWAEAVPHYTRARLEGAGVPPAEIEEALAFVEAQVHFALHREGFAELERRYAEGRGSAWQQALGFQAPAPNPPDAPGWDAFREFLSPDPSDMYRSIDAPVLVVLGAADPRVPGEIHGARARELLSAGASSRWDVWVVPGANHGLMEVRTGPEGKDLAPDRYADGVHSRLVEWARSALHRP